MMKSLRSSFVLVAALFVSPMVVMAEAEGPVAQLKAGDVKHFLESFPKMILLGCRS